MSTGRTHPHIDRATEAQLTELLQGKDPELREIYLAVHRLIVETLPDVDHSTDCADWETGYGARQYGYDGWGMAALGIYKKYVRLTFLHGADLEDPSGLLEGTKLMRHIRFQTVEQFEKRKEELRRLVRLAAQLHME